MTNLYYTKTGDYSIPNRTLSETLEIGKYGRMRRNYLKEHRPVLYNRLLLSEKLYPHRSDIELTAKRSLGQMIHELVRSSGAHETMKATDPMKWTGLMNNLKSQAEEMILSELIYS